MRDPPVADDWWIASQRENAPQRPAIISAVLAWLVLTNLITPSRWSCRNLQRLWN
jgi:hypothetical protein